jgi:hypothetical protein
VDSITQSVMKPVHLGGCVRTSSPPPRPARTLRWPPTRASLLDLNSTTSFFLPPSSPSPTICALPSFISLSPLPLPLFNPLLLLFPASPSVAPPRLASHLQKLFLENSFPARVCEPEKSSHFFFSINTHSLSPAQPACPLSHHKKSPRTTIGNL